MLLWFAMLLDKTPKYSNDIKGTMTKQHFSNNLSENRTFIAHIDSLRSPQSHTYTLNMQAKSTQRISLHSVQNEMPSDCAQNSYLDQYVVFIIANFTHPFSAHHTSALVPISHPLTSLPFDSLVPSQRHCSPRAPLIPYYSWLLQLRWEWQKNNIEMHCEKNLLRSPFCAII